MSEDEKLPYVCPDHPQAQILREWEEVSLRIHLTGVTTPSKVKNEHYYCNDCKRELRSEK